MKNEQEIKDLLHAEIENQNRLNKLYIEAIHRGDSIKDISNILTDSSLSMGRILAFKDALNHS